MQVGKGGVITKAGRALQKKLGRPNASAWPQISGVKNEAAYSSAADDLLQDMLTDPSGVWTFGRGRISGQYADVWDVRLNNGLGARFDAHGNFETFLD
jgi:hypothetical protein